MEGAKFNNTSRNYWKPTFEVHFSTNSSSPGNSQNCLYGDVIKMASLLESVMGPFRLLPFSSIVYAKSDCAYVHIDKE